MKKELGILLLIFIATVGLSSAASAAPIATTAHGPNTYGHGGQGIHVTPYRHWVIFRRFIVASPFAVNMIRHRYHPPMFRVTATYIGRHKWVATVWRQVYFRR